MHQTTLWKRKYPKNNNIVMLKTRGKLVDILQEINPENHESYIYETKNGKISCFLLKMMLCRMLKSSMMCYWKFQKDIEKQECQVNPCKICTANKIINNNQYTLAWHVDDIKASHSGPKVNDEFIE